MQPKPLSCSACGAPLTADLATRAADCAHCGTRHVFDPAVSQARRARPRRFRRWRRDDGRGDAGTLRWEGVAELGVPVAAAVAYVDWTAFVAIAATVLVIAAIVWLRHARRGRARRRVRTTVRATPR